MIRQLALLVSLLGFVGPAAIADPTVLESDAKRVSMVELFTSEGCSSCPPADKWLSKLVDDPRLWTEIVPIAFHVDYWDYLGWKDRFASEDFTSRQRMYARSGHVRQVYTPGFVVAGQEWRGWFRRPDLKLDDNQQAGVLRVEIDGGRVAARYNAFVKVRQPRLNVALLGFGLETPVAAGENHGRTLRHEFVVLGHQIAPMTRDGQNLIANAMLPTAIEPAQRFAVAAWVSDGRDPKPVQAVGGWFTPE